MTPLQSILEGILDTGDDIPMNDLIEKAGLEVSQLTPRGGLRIKCGVDNKIDQFIFEALLAQDNYWKFEGSKAPIFTATDIHDVEIEGDIWINTKSLATFNNVFITDSKLSVFDEGATFNNCKISGIINFSSMAPIENIKFKKCEFFGSESRHKESFLLFVVDYSSKVRTEKINPEKFFNLNNCKGKIMVMVGTKYANQNFCNYIPTTAGHIVQTKNKNWYKW